MFKLRIITRNCIESHTKALRSIRSQSFFVYGKEKSDGKGNNKLFMTLAFACKTWYTENITEAEWPIIQFCYLKCLKGE